MHQKIAAAIAVSAMILALVGCGGEDKPPQQSSAPPSEYEETFYVTPNYEVYNNYQLDYKNLMELKEKLGTGGRYAKIGFMGISRYMN